MKQLGILVLTAGLVAVAPGVVLASGFSVYEQSAKASGQAGAWVARADDAAAAWYNPAAMVHNEGMQIQFGINIITIGSDTDITTGDPFWGLNPESPSTFSTESGIASPIHFYLTKKVSEKMAWGVGVTNPMGLITEWNDIPVTLSHRRAELVTFVINPNIAYAFNDQWSGAIGINYMFADVKDFARVIDQSAALEQPPLTVLGGTNLTGDGDDWGFNVALHYAGEGMSFGFTYRGELSPKIEGNVEWSGIHPALEQLFPNGPGSTTLDLPAQAAIGFAWDVADDWVMEFDISYAGWSSFKSLDIDFENETPAVSDITLREDWDDTMAFRLGAAWSVNDKHELRFGALYDQSPVPTDTLRPSIPDSDRTSVTFGYGFKGAKWDFDAYYMPLFFDDITSNGSAAEGVINGTYSSFVHLLGATINYRF